MTPFASSNSATAASSVETALSETVSSASTPIGTAATGSAAMPSWINTLQNASIANDMIAADVNGTVTYAGIEKLIADLDSSLASSGTSLTASEFSDLKTVAANLNNGMETPAYLTSIMNALVNGNAANASWTGGAASSTSLGNLAVGSSATQLSELNDKWFLGTDLPSSKVTMSGDPSFSVSYSADSCPLFGANGPSMSDINQGDLGDCYFLSSLAEVAQQNSSIISSMFTSNGNGTYGVRFYVDGTAEYVTVNNLLADGGNIFNYGSDIWASLAEKAYAQLQTGGAVTGNFISGNSWSAVGNGGDPEYALEEITGASAITDFCADGSSWETVVYNSSLDETSFSSRASTASVLDTLVSDLSKGDDLVLGSCTNAESSGYQTLVADHAMSIYGFDSGTDLLEIRNPWGTEAGQYWDTTFEVGLGTLLSDGDTITVDDAGAGQSQQASQASPPTVTAQTAIQTWKFGEAVNFALASNTFTDPQGESLTYKATQANGTALPSWLRFNAATQTFTGTPPVGSANLSIKVTATDTSGLSASEIFTADLVAPAAPTIGNHTANQIWIAGQTVNFTLASNTFTDPQGESLTYGAKLANGSQLPSWLTFNATTRTFTGTVPKKASGFSIKVTAVDAGGASASETFSVSTPAAARKTGAANVAAAANLETTDNRQISQITSADVGFGTNATLGHIANSSNTDGTLTGSESGHAASIALLAQYAAASFVAAGDGYASTTITHPAVVAETQLTHLHA